MFVYIIKSNKNNRFYIGSAENVALRLEQHNKGENKSTKAYRPWSLAKVEEYSNKSLALKRERFLKSGVGRRVVRNLVG